MQLKLTLNRIQTAFDFLLQLWLAERRKPKNGKLTEHRLNCTPFGLFHPFSLLLLQLLDASLVVPNCIELCAQHNYGEDSKKKTFKSEKEQQDDGGGRREWGTFFPFMFYAHRKLIDTHEKRMNRYQCNVAAKQHEKLLISLADTVVDPWTKTKIRFVSSMLN